ncbi:protein of unknown function [Streptomyces sp. Amel2xC10]|nr:protein of unknown function [Streptomyces sp. Amel2xC10]
MLTALEVFTTVTVGLMVGVEFSVAFVMNRILNALPEDAGQLARAHGGRILGALMPFWYTGSLALSALWAIAGRDRPGTALVVTAATLLTVSVIMSLLLLVPINNRGKTWTPPKPARRLEGTDEPLGPLPLRPRRRHHRRLHLSGHRPDLNPPTRPTRRRGEEPCRWRRPAPPPPPSPSPSPDPGRESALRPATPTASPAGEATPDASPP